MTQTKLANLINPQVFSAELSVKLGNKIKLLPLAYTEDFTGEEGSVISVPSYTYTGDASVIAEGVAIDPKLLNQGMTSVTVKKVGEGFELTDEAVKNGKGDPVGTAEEFLLAAIAGGIEREMHTALGTATLTYATPAGGKLTGDGVLGALGLFGEDFEGKKYLLANPNQLPNIIKDAAYVKDTNSIYDCEVIFSARVASGTAYVVKPEAVALYLSKEVQVETQRNILTKATVITADEHFATHLRDASKAVKVTITA